MKKRFWGYVFLTLLVVAIAACFLWEDILLLAAPKVILTTSLTNVIDQLEERFQENPMKILLRALEQDGQYTANVNMQMDNKLLGNVNYDMTVQTDIKAHRIRATGRAATEQREIDLSLYMDTDYMAVSSDGLVDGQYYGISYDSFVKDIRSIPLLNLMINDNLLTEWEGAVHKIQDGMQQEVVLPVIPEIKAAEIKALLFGIIALPCQTEKTTFWLDDEVVTCKKMDYHLEGAAVGEVISSLTNQSFGSDASVQISFYLYEKSIIRMAVICRSDSKNIQATVDLGMNPLENPLSIEYSKQGMKTNSYFGAVVNTLRAENIYSERWEVRNINNGNESFFSCRYVWNPSNGAMEVSLNDAVDNVSFVFRENTEGIYIQTYDFGRFVKMFSQTRPLISLGNDVECSMIISGGSIIDKPGYKNLNQWTASDFLGLMSGVGSLIGINLK